MTTLAQQHEQTVRATPSASQMARHSLHLNELHFLALAYGLTGLAWISAQWASACWRRWARGCWPGDAPSA